MCPICEGDIDEGRLGGVVSDGKKAQYRGYIHAIVEPPNGYPPFENIINVTLETAQGHHILMKFQDTEDLKRFEMEIRNSYRNREKLIVRGHEHTVTKTGSKDLMGKGILRVKAPTEYEARYLFNIESVLPS